MANYRRLLRPGGVFFLTQITANRAAFLCDDAACPILHNAIAETHRTRPFTMEAIVLLPDHFHVIWRMPRGNSAYSLRMAAVNARFTRT